MREIFNPNEKPVSSEASSNADQVVDSPTTEETDSAAEAPANSPWKGQTFPTVYDDIAC